MTQYGKFKEEKKLFVKCIQCFRPHANNLHVNFYVEPSKQPYKLLDIASHLKGENIEAQIGLSKLIAGISAQICLIPNPSVLR